MNCDIAYNQCAPVCECAEKLHIQTPKISEAVIIRILDKFQHVQYFNVTTDAQGIAEVLTSALPIAFLNEHAGTFNVSVFQLLERVKLGTYDSINFKTAKISPIETISLINTTR